MEDDMVNNASKLSVMAIGSLVAISIYSTPAQAAPATTHNASPVAESSTISAVAAKPLPESVSPAEINRLNSTLNPSTPKTMSASGVPGGYHRPPGQRLNNYRFKSSNIYFGNYHCVNKNCTLSSEVQAVWQENIQGGSSKRWTLTTVATTFKAGGPRWSLRYGYSCGVNVSLSADHTCRYGASASGVSGALTSRKNYSWNFENRSSGVNYPMFALTVKWTDGVTQTNRIRGWDVCNGKSVTLCSSSGT